MCHSIRKSGLVFTWCGISDSTCRFTCPFNLFWERKETQRSSRSHTLMKRWRWGKEKGKKWWPPLTSLRRLKVGLHDPELWLMTGTDAVLGVPLAFLLFPYFHPVLCVTLFHIFWTLLSPVPCTVLALIEIIRNKVHKTQCRGWILCQCSRPETLF